MRARAGAVAAAATVMAMAGVLVGAPAATAKGGEVGGTGSSYYLSDTFSTKANVEFTYGRPGDEVFVGDWDGDGRDTLAIRRGATFHVRNTNTTGGADYTFTYGRPGDIVLAGDWNGDGRDTLAVRRGPVYHVKNTLTGGPADQEVVYGRAGDAVLVGDWNGDGTDTFAVRRGAEYHVKNSIAPGKADKVAVYGRPGDSVYVGDFDGDTLDTFTVRRGAQYFIANQIRAGEADRTVVYGRSTDTTMVGDWNGDGVDSLGVRRDVQPAPVQPPDGPGGSSEAAQALAALDRIDVATSLAGGYDRDRFGSGWATTNGCDTRNRVLNRDLINISHRAGTSGCIVETGTLQDPYTGKTINFVRGVGTSNAVQIDHVVAVASAWRLGANAWTDAERRAFYNDLDNLLAVDGPTNSSKGDSTLGEWQPPNSAAHCAYAITYIEVTYEYDLALTYGDVAYARELLPTC